MDVSTATGSRRRTLTVETPLVPAAIRLIIVFLLYVAMTVFVFRNVVGNIGSVLLGPPEDNLQDLWNTWYAAVHVRGLGDFLGTKLLRYPEGTELFYHSFSYPKIVIVALLGSIVSASSSTLITTQNILLLVSYPVGALGAFYLVRHYTRESVGAFVGGVVFGFNPSHVQQSMHHMHVESIEFLPFFMLFFIIAAERKSIAMLCLSILCYVLSALSCWYYLFYAGYFMVFYVAFQGIADRRWPTLWEVGSIVAHGLTLALIASPLLMPMITSAVSGATVTLQGMEMFGADAAGYFSFPKQHLLSALGNRVRWRLQGNEWEGATYLGLINLGLLAWYCTRNWSGPWRQRLFLLSGMAVFGVFASGSWLLLLGHRIIPMPDWVLMKLPMFSNVRTPARAVVFMHLFLAIGVGLALVAAWRGRARGWFGTAVVTGLTVVLLLDWYPATIVSTPFSCPAGYRVITADNTAEFGVLDLPVVEYIDWNAAMAFQSCHGRPIVGGVVSRELTPTLRDQLIVGDVKAQHKQLEESRVKYIVIHPQAGVVFAWSDNTDGLVADYLAEYTTVYRGADATVLQVYP